MTLILDVKGLSKGFEMHHLGTRMAAFSDISFNLSAGEFLLLKGRNGAGKSTLLRTLYRSYLAASGQILFHSSHGVVDLARAADVDVTLLRRTEIGFVTQFLTARPRVSAEALVAEPLRLAGGGGAGRGKALAVGLRRQTRALGGLSDDVFRRRTAEGEPGPGADPAAATAHAG